MLTITAPIELKCKAPVSFAQEQFYHRIADNYLMLQQKLTPEDLLHAVTTPPEYYFGGEAQTTIFQQTNVSSAQQNKLEIINHLINRILIAESAQLTYQDRVYITDSLQKLGIQNVNEFMQQVTQVRQEVHNTEQLIDLYWNHAQELQQLIEDYRSEQIDSRQQQVYTAQNERLYLHEEIMNRLQTGAIYQMLQNFHSHAQGEQTITWNELQISEQHRLSKQLLLQKLKNTVREENEPLAYYHENYYEQQQLAQEELNETTVLRQVSSAVLLQMIDSVLNSRIEQQLRGDTSWYHMEHAFYQNAENTMKRFEHRMYENSESVTEKQELYLTQHNEADKKEISLLQQLIQNTRQEQLVSNLLQRQTVQEGAKISNQVTEAQTALTQLELTQTEEALTQDTRIENQTVDARNLSLVEQELSRINRENINQQSKYLQMVQIMQEAMEPPREKKNAERLRQERLLALEHPEELVAQLRAEGEAQQEAKQEKLTQAALQLLPKETRAIYETVREYLEVPRELRQQIPGVSTDISTLIREVHAAETVHEQTQQQLERQHISEQTELLREQWNEQKKSRLESQQPKQIFDRQHTDVTLVHKHSEQHMDEELVNELLEQNRKLQKTVRTTTQQQTNVERTQRTVTNLNTQHLHEQTENVNELVRQGVQRELGVLSEKIYSKLEKRLETEKRRRGY